MHGDHVEDSSLLRCHTVAIGRELPAIGRELPAIGRELPAIDRELPAIG